MEQKHKYGNQVVLLDHPFLNTLLTRLCLPVTQQPQVHEYVETLYLHLGAHVLSKELKIKPIQVPTRMTAVHKDQMLEARIFDPSQKAVTVSLARAGIPASQIIFNLLNSSLDPKRVRQDHIWATRLTDGKDRVTGTDLAAAKIGGNVDRSFVFLPDPMGATGSTIVSTIDLYKSKYKGKNARFVVLHLIVTPEYLKTVLTAHKDLKIYALRLDRGLSDKKVLASIPGTHWDKEKGLNSKQYIVPGAGGLGEILNNSFV